MSFTGIEDTGDAAVDARSRELAEAYGLRYLLIGPSPGTTTTAAAALGIPAVLGEVGGQGRWPAEDVALHAAGFRRLLRAAGLIDDAPSEPAHRTELLPTEAWMRATHTGYWHPAVAVGDRVTPGSIVGEVQDAFGAVLERPVGADGRRRHLPRQLARDERRRPAARPRRMSDPTRAHVTRIVTDGNGGTAFADADVTLELGDFAPPAPPMLRSEPVAARAVRFLGAAAGWDSPPHPAPARQYIVMLRGTVRCDGVRRRDAHVRAGRRRAARGHDRRGSPDVHPRGRGLARAGCRPRLSARRVAVSRPRGAGTARSRAARSARTRRSSAARPRQARRSARRPAP